MEEKEKGKVLAIDDNEDILFQFLQKVLKLRP